MSVSEKARQGYRTLAESMPHLRDLDALRSQVRTLRDSQLRLLLSEEGFEYERRRYPATPTTCLFFRRAKHLAWHLGLIAHCEESYYPLWPTACLNPLPTATAPSAPDPTALGASTPGAAIVPSPTATAPRKPKIPPPTTATSVHLLATKPGDTPLFFATQYLRAKLENLDTGFITPDCFRCYYALLRDLYTVSQPEMSFGGISADGAGGPKTVFVTSECARALYQFVTGMRRLLEFMESAHQLNTQRNSLCGWLREGPGPLPPTYEWQDAGNIRAEIELRLTISLRSLVENRLDDVFINIRTPEGPDKDKFDAWVDAILVGLRSFATESLRSCNQVLAELGTTDPPKEHYSKSGHDIAKRAIESGQRGFEMLANASLELASELDGYMKLFKLVLRPLNKRVQMHLRLMQTWLEAAMYRAAFLASHDADQEAFEDLVLASDAFGSITQQWKHPVFETVLEAIEKHLDYLGKIPRGHAFSIRNDGISRYLEAPHAIRAIAHILQNADRELSSDTVRRLLRNFDHLAATRSEAEGFPPSHLPAWLRAISCIALHRIEVMLSVRINDAVKRHFDTLTPTLMGQRGTPRLEGLMWTDIGITQALRASSNQRATIHAVLYEMRNALGYGNATTSDLPTTRSLLLYGPPGTGKSTLLESLAVTSGSDLVTVSPDSFFFEGLESLERQCAHVMDALGMLTNTVILFDEFEQMIAERKGSAASDTRLVVRTQIDFLTTNMLPKISRLNARVKGNRCVYAAATNFVDVMDEAAIREQRFDRKVCVYFPDPTSRMTRLVHTMIKKLPAADSEARNRMAMLSCGARFASAARLGNVGWFGGSTWEASPVGSHLRLGTPVDVDWSLPKREHAQLTTRTAGRYSQLDHERDMIVAITSMLEREAGRLHDSAESWESVLLAFNAISTNANNVASDMQRSYESVIVDEFSTLTSVHLREDPLSAGVRAATASKAPPSIAPSTDGGPDRTTPA